MLRETERMKNITIGDKTHGDLLTFKLRLSLTAKKEATYDDAVQCLLEFWKRQTGEGKE